MNWWTLLQKIEWLFPHLNTYDNNFTWDEQKVEFTHYQFIGSPYIQLNRWSCIRIKLAFFLFQIKHGSFPCAEKCMNSNQISFEHENKIWIHTCRVLRKKRRDVMNICEKKLNQLKWCLTVMRLNLDLDGYSTWFYCFLNIYKTFKSFVSN